MAGEKVNTSRIDRLNIFCLDGRLQSFKLAKWPQFSSNTKKPSSSSEPTFKITPDSMANAGFHARPIEGSADNACCGYCRKNLDGWGATDVAWDEHVSHSAGCPLVNLGEQINRELTFTMAGWPHTGSIAPSKMAKAGFFHWPKCESGDDTAICVQCGLALDGWEPNDDPRHEHSRRRPKCPFLVTGKAHSPAHFELLFASKNVEDAMREWDGSVKTSPVKTVPVSVKKPQAKRAAASPPKFKMPTKAAAAIPSVLLVSKDVESTPRVARLLPALPNDLESTPRAVRAVPALPKQVEPTPRKTKPIPKIVQSTPQKVNEPTDERTAKRTRTSSRQSSIRHAEPSFKLPIRLDEPRPSAILAHSLLPSFQSTPLTKRSAQPRPRASSIKTVVPVPPPIDHAALALKELAENIKPLKPTKEDLDRPLSEYLRSLVGKRISDFEDEATRQFSSFEASVA